MGFEVDKAETFASAFVVYLYNSRSDGAVSLEQLDKLVLARIRVDVFDI